MAVKKQKSISKEGAGKTTKATKKKKEPTADKVVEEEEVAEEEKEDAWAGIEEGDELDEKTKALVKALDSGDEDGDEIAGTYEKGQDVGKVPKVSSKAKRSIASSNPEHRGTIYVGHIPFGFFEHQMKEVRICSRILFSWRYC